MIEAIKKGFTVAVKNLQLVLIVYGVGVVFGLLSLPFARQMAMGAVRGVPRISVGLFFIIVLSVLVQIFVMGGVLGCVQEAVKKGLASISAFINFGAKYYVRLLLSGLLGFAIALVYGLIAALVIGGIAAGPVVVKIILGLLLAGYILLGVVLSLLLVFWPYAIVTEDIGVIAGLKKSIDIARKPTSNLLRIFAILCITVIAAVVINLIVSLPQFLFARWIVVTRLYQIFVVGAVGAYLNIFIVSVLMVYYFTLKGEGGSGATTTAAPQTAPSTETPSS